MLALNKLRNLFLVYLNFFQFFFLTAEALFGQIDPKCFGSVQKNLIYEFLRRNFCLSILILIKEKKKIYSLHQIFSRYFYRSSVSPSKFFSLFFLFSIRPPASSSPALFPYTATLYCASLSRSFTFQLLSPHHLYHILSCFSLQLRLFFSLFKFASFQSSPTLK